MSAYRDELRAATERLGVNVLYSYKTHFNAATIWRIVYYATGLPTVALAALVAVLAFQSGSDPAKATGWLAVTLAVVRGIAEFLNPERQRKSHQTFGAAYHTLHSDVGDFYDLDFIDDTKADADLRTRFDELQARRNELNNEAPLPMRPAYWMTRATVKKEAEYTEDDLKLFRDRPARKDV